MLVRFWSPKDTHYRTCPQLSRQISLKWTHDGANPASDPVMAIAPPTRDQANRGPRCPLEDLYKCGSAENAQDVVSDSCHESYDDDSL